LIRSHFFNLTLFPAGQLKWVTHFCPNALYVMHVDDDVFADVENIVRHLLQEESSRYMLFCLKLYVMVCREGKTFYFPSRYACLRQSRKNVSVNLRRILYY